MLKWTLFFLILTIISAVIGFTNVIDYGQDLAQFLFFTFAFLLSTTVLFKIAEKGDDYPDNYNF